MSDLFLFPPQATFPRVHAEMEHLAGLPQPVIPERERRRQEPLARQFLRGHGWLDRRRVHGLEAEFV